MKIITFFGICSAFVFLVSCQCESDANRLNSNYYNSLKDTLYLPFDTTRVLNMYDFHTRVNKFQELESEKIADLVEDLDTLELELQHLACDCPNWYDMSRRPSDATPEMSPFYGYYLEAGSPELCLPEGLLNAKVKFIGRHYKVKGWPANTQFINPEPPAGNVFRYYAYELLLPAEMFGPLYHTGKREIPSDPEELIMATILKIKKHR